MRKHFVGFQETVSAEMFDDLKYLVGDTKVGYSVIILARDLSYKGRMPTYKIFTSTNIKALQGILEFIGQTGKTKIEHTHAWMETPVRLFVHSHKRGNVPHGHHGARYWGLVKEVLRSK